MFLLMFHINQYHRMFSMKTLYDDVAIIRLSQPVTFTRYIQPICLSTNTWGYENQMASVAGQFIVRKCS